MTLLLNVASGLLVVVGLTFFLGGTIGLVRLPDFYARSHATGMGDSMGAGSILLGIALHDGLAFSDLKLALLVLLVAFSGPTSAHALARAGFRTGLAPKARKGGDES